MSKGLLAAMMLGAAVGQVWGADEPTPLTSPTTSPPSSPPSSATPDLAPPPPLSAAALWRPDNRVFFGADWDTLSGTKGGYGGNIGYLDEPTVSTLVGVGVEYQNLAGSYWSFGSVNAAFTHALTTNSRWSLRAEAHEGDGRTGGQDFNYSIVAGGLGLSLPGGVALDAEERQIDVDTSHGSLPKLGLSKAWGTHLLTSVAYAESFSGNLHTSYGLTRVDFYSRFVDLLVGGDFGRVNPTVININGVLQPEARHLKEVFAGVTKPIHRVDLTLLGDDLNLAGIKRFTLTLNSTVHL
jgi:hypothetical protein